MPEHVAKISDFPPWNFGMGIFEFGGKSTTPFGNDLKGSLDDLTNIPIGAKILQCFVSNFSGQVVDVINHIVDDRSKIARTFHMTRTASESI